MANLRNLMKSNMARRVLSSLFLAPVVLVAVYAGGPLYGGIVLVFISLAMYEWVRLVHARDGDFGKAGIWLVLGIFYVGGSALSLLYLRMNEGGAALVYYLLAIVWGTDIGAYLVGKAVGGAKLVPKISPNKTWAGFFGGLALASLFGYGVHRFLETRTDLTAGLTLALILSMVSQGGDLFESWMKRRSGLKESGNIIPGHGGVLDRVDGLIPAAICLALLQGFMTEY